MTKLMRRGIPVLGITALIISNDSVTCKKILDNPPPASKVYICAMDAEIVKEMINLYKPKAVYVVFSKSERAGKNVFSVIGEYSALYNLRVGIVGSGAQLEAVRRVYGFDTVHLTLPYIRRDIAKVRNLHSEHASALADRIKGISEDSELLVAVFVRNLETCAYFEDLFDTYFRLNGIRLRPVYINILASSVRTIRDKLISPDLMVLPAGRNGLLGEKTESVIASAAFRNIPYITYSESAPSEFSLPDKRMSGNGADIADAISRISVKK